MNIYTCIQQNCPNTSAFALLAPVTTGHESVMTSLIASQYGALAAFTLRAADIVFSEAKQTVTLVTIAHTRAGVRVRMALTLTYSVIVYNIALCTLLRTGCEVWNKR